jgi:surfeit locus 1 family protein
VPRPAVTFSPVPSRRQFAAALLGLTAAAACVKAAFWQIDRLHQRRARNAVQLSRLAAQPTSPFALPAESTRQWRRVIVTGTFDFDHQIVLAGRALEGAPGVNIITPFVPDGRSDAILVNRGWVYAPDAQTVNVAKFDEPPHQTIRGYAEEFSQSKSGAARTASTPDAWRRLDAAELPTAFPFAIATFYMVALADSGVRPSPSAPVRLPLPSLDEGPHLGYAIQWFAFALIALGGASIVIYREHRAAPGNP